MKTIIYTIKEALEEHKKLKQLWNESKDSPHKTRSLEYHTTAIEEHQTLLTELETKTKENNAEQ